MSTSADTSELLARLEACPTCGLRLCGGKHCDCGHSLKRHHIYEPNGWHIRYCQDCKCGAQK